MVSARLVVLDETGVVFQTSENEGVWLLLLILLLILHVCFAYAMYYVMCIDVCKMDLFALMQVKT